MTVRFTKLRLVAIVLCLSAIVGATLVLAGHPPGTERESHFFFAPTAYSQSTVNDCPDNLECWEQCFTNASGQSVGTGNLCCGDESTGQCVRDAR